MTETSKREQETENGERVGDWSREEGAGSLSDTRHPTPDTPPDRGDALSYKQRVAFKIGARARKFALEGCPIEGYDYLYACLADARANDAPLYALLQIEAEKLDRRIAAIEE